MSSQDWIEANRAKWKYRGQERPPFAVAPQPGQESVWDYPRPPRLAPDSREVVVRLGSVEIARSSRSTCSSSGDSHRTIGTRRALALFLLRYSVPLSASAGCPSERCAGGSARSGGRSGFLSIGTDFWVGSASGGTKSFVGRFCSTTTFVLPPFWM